MIMLALSSFITAVLAGFWLGIGVTFLIVCRQMLSRPVVIGWILVCIFWAFMLGKVTAPFF